MTKKAIAKFRDYFAIRDNTSAEYIDWYVTADLKQVLSVYKQRNRKFYITYDFDFITAVLTFWFKFSRKICKYFDTKDFYKCAYGLCRYYQNLNGCNGYCRYTKAVI